MIKGSDGKPYREGGVWIRRVAAEKPEPPKIDRRPDSTQEAAHNEYRAVGIRAILFLLKLKNIPPRKVISAAFYPRRKHGTKKF